MDILVCMFPQSLFFNLEILSKYSDAMCLWMKQLLYLLDLKLYKSVI